MTRVRVERAGAVWRIVLSRPEKRNALDRAMVEALQAALAEAEQESAVRVVALAADGSDFCAGADLEALASMLDAPAAVHQADAEALARLFLRVRRLRVPVVAVVRGRALAGGAGLACACDLVLADEAAQFGYPEVRVGFVPAMVMALLRRAVGEKVAADLVLTGRTVSADEAKSLGLVSRVLPSAGFDAAVLQALAELAEQPPGALAATKRLLYDLDGVSFADGLALGAERNVAARATDEFRSGVRRYVPKRGDG